MRLRSLLWLGALLPALPAHANLADRPEVQAFIETVATEHELDAGQLKQLFAGARVQQEIIDAISRPAERTLSWGEYRQIFLDQARITQGVAFWQQHEDALERAADDYGVPAELVVAILGVETRYGRIKGRWRVIDALSTLAFDYPPRADFFRRELAQFLVLADEEGRPAEQLTGSYAGAMGYGQFIPSSYRAYAVDFDGDGLRDIWDNSVDALGSVANYLARHGWQKDAEVVREVTLTQPLDDLLQRGLKPYTHVEALRARGVEGLDALPADAEATLMALEAEEGTRHFVGLKNFYAITRYNHSALYAMAVHELSQALRAARPEAES